MNPPALEALLFGCMKGHKMSPVVAFGSHQEPSHGQTKYLSVNPWDVAVQDFCTQLLTIF